MERIIRDKRRAKKKVRNEILATREQNR